MSDFETLFGMPSPRSHATESKSKPVKKSETNDSTADSPAELWFWRGSLTGIVVTAALFALGDYLGVNRRDAVENGTRAFLTEWIEANPKITAAEVLHAVRTGVKHPSQSKTGDAVPSPSISTPK